VSSAELVYGNPLTVPGEVLSTLEASSQEILDRIRFTVMSFNTLLAREPPHERGAASKLEILQQAIHMYVLLGGS
jgi:hypothetical protein